MSASLLPELAPPEPLPVPAEPKRERMTAAHFVTMREACGMTLQEVANMVGLKIRAIQMWEEGQRRVSLEASDKLLELDALIRRLTTEVLQAATSKRRRGSKMVLIRYKSADAYAKSVEAQAGLPFCSHPAMLARLADGLTRLGVPFSIDWG